MRCATTSRRAGCIANRGLMHKGWFTKIFGTQFQRELKRIRPIVDAIHRHEERLKGLSDAELQGQTAKLRGLVAERTGVLAAEVERLKQEKHECPDADQRVELSQQLSQAEAAYVKALQGALSEVLPEAFATVREACRRLVGSEVVVTGHALKWEMIPYDVQLIGGVVLHQGKIAEMATGEGKTLVATLPMYLNALPGRGVHLVTVNDYLAQRDSEWMGQIFKFLGLTVGVILQTMQPWDRHKEYASDITYGTNNEFGFDYLRDNMVTRVEDMVQRPHNYAIVDEVDSVLVDEARTPLIISGPVESAEHKFDELKPHVERLINAQKNLVAKIMSEAEELLKSEDAEKRKEAGVLLVRAHHGMAKNKRLMKLMSDGEMMRLMQTTELEYMRDSSRNMHIIDDEL